MILDELKLLILEVEDVFDPFYIVQHADGVFLRADHSYHCGKVKDVVEVIRQHHRGNIAKVVHIGFNEFPVGKLFRRKLGQEASGKIVHDHHEMTGIGDQPFHERASNVARSSGNQYLSFC